MTQRSSRKSPEKITKKKNKSVQKTIIEANVLDLSVAQKKPIETFPKHFTPTFPISLQSSASLSAAAAFPFAGWPEMFLNGPGSLLSPAFPFSPDPLGLLHNFLMQPRPLPPQLVPAFSMANFYPKPVPMETPAWPCPPAQPCPPQVPPSKAKLPKIQVEETLIDSPPRKKNSYKDAPRLISCPVNGCQQKFPWNSSLKRHILTHTRTFIPDLLMPGGDELTSI